MKKLLFCFSLFSMVIALASCGNKSKTEEKEDDEEAFELEKGDIRVILEVTQSDILEILANGCQNTIFKKSLAEAQAESNDADMDFVNVFVSKWKNNGGNELASIFATSRMRDKVNAQSTDKEVIQALKEEIKAATDNTELVLRNRLDNLGLDYNLQLLNGHRKLIMAEIARPKDKDRLLKVLVSNANIEFWETYHGNELYYVLQQLLDTYDKQLALEDSIMNTMGSPDSLGLQSSSTKPVTPRLILTNLPYSVIGYASVKDTATINRMLDYPGVQTFLRNLTEGEARLVWSAKPAEGYSTKEPVFELYALKVTDPSGRAPLEGDVITSAKAYIEYSRPVVTINMNSEGARVWAELTRKNLQRSIAIVMDNVVYTAPTIQSEITGGASQISGNFTVEDTEDLANVLSSGKMPASVRIISYEVIGE